MLALSWFQRLWMILLSLAWTWTVVLSFSVGWTTTPATTTSSSGSRATISRVPPNKYAPHCTDGSRHRWRLLSPFFLLHSSLSSSSSSLLSSSSSSFTTVTENNNQKNHKMMVASKENLLHLGAVLDRGQAYNPTSGAYYADRMDVARHQIRAFLEAHPDRIPQRMDDIAGEWELVLTTVPHGIFRSSPFFLAIQEAYEVYAQEKEAFGMPKAELFFKLHELQTMSWGVSKVGRVAQHITNDTIYSEFDTSIFSLTVIPILGWFKLLPTFGGCVVTAAKAQLEVTKSSSDPNNNDQEDQDVAILKMVVDYTTARPVPGLSGLGEWIWKIQVPVGAIWKVLPWNQGREAVCQVYIRYCDDDFRIVEDRSGDLFVYTRPLLPRPLDLAESTSSSSSSDTTTDKA